MMETSTCLAPAARAAAFAVRVERRKNSLARVALCVKTSVASTTTSCSPSRSAAEGS